MQKERWKLVGSAPTKEHLEKLINEKHFFGDIGSRNIQIQDDGTLVNISKNRTLDYYRAITKNGRWRFEEKID